MASTEFDDVIVCHPEESLVLRLRSGRDGSTLNCPILYQHYGAGYSLRRFFDGTQVLELVVCSS